MSLPRRAHRPHRDRVVIDKAASVDRTVELFGMSPTRVAGVERIVATILERKRGAGGRKSKHSRIAA